MAGAILAHIADLFDWPHSMANGRREWHEFEQSWSDDAERFLAALAAFDAYLAANQPLQAPAEKLLQAPIADALTPIRTTRYHAPSRWLPIKSENYFSAEIAAGRLGPDQAAPKREFWKHER
jgi:hypothetical protein